MSGQFAVEGASIEREDAIEIFRVNSDHRILRWLSFLRCWLETMDIFMNI